ncbi:hypothetical protein [Nonomuraea diastatica]|uniref:Uncharacterized protein n=1 Tax=Nonomuraea diastatica TaxID=1848329 RepID=A0A4R4WV83_9ACTN|nr:hypothetical protein [Nonomuraea diastatica]TDD21581.1 hypothetical protein E1294_14135 [Nonomuraea diastatica]
MSDSQGRPSKVDVEVASRPTKSKARSPHDRWATSKELAWSGTTTGKADVSRHTLQIPAGKLQKRRQVRWRARTTVVGEPGVWSAWQTFTIGAPGRDRKSPTRTATPTSSESASTTIETTNKLVTAWGGSIATAQR